MKLGQRMVRRFHQIWKFQMKRMKMKKEREMKILGLLLNQRPNPNPHPRIQMGSERHHPVRLTPRRVRRDVSGKNTFPHRIYLTFVDIGPKVNVEYEVETEPLSREMLRNW
jgi:hypothetical protein